MRKLIIFFKSLFFKTPKKKQKLSNHLYELMKGGRYYTLIELKNITGYSVNSISAAIRDFRKIKNGNNKVVKQRIVYPVKSNREYKYRLQVNVFNDILENKNRKNK